MPARSGSVRIPGKNIRLFHGKPLIHWTIQAALECEVFDRIIVSTDSPEIALIAVEAGAEVPKLRSPALAGSEVTSEEVIADFLAEEKQIKRFTLLQPTSPLRTSEHIRQATELFEELAPFSVVSAVSLGRSGEDVFPLQSGETDSQPWPFCKADRGLPLVKLNGAIYIVESARFLKSMKFVSPETVFFMMPEHLSVDIDLEDDWQHAEAVFSKQMRSEEPQ